MTATWITGPTELDDWLSANTAQPLALDTEFERVNTFYPIPGLVQLGLGDQFRLVDPSVAEASQVFCHQLADPSRLKLLYAMSEDLELFRHWLALEPAGVLDLQIGAAMAGAGFSVGYARLVEQRFGEVLDKSATRSDWVSRPLSAAQEHYATDDIRFLKPIYQWLKTTLTEKNLFEAWREESARFAADLAEQDDPASHYLKLRGGWALSPGQQGVLKALVQWREVESRQRDRPRNRVLADALLISIAETLPGSLRELSAIRDLPAVVVRRYGERILALVGQAINEDHSAMSLIAPPLPRQDQARYKQVKRLMVEAAESVGLPIELLAPRKRLEAVVQARSLAPGLLSEGWRSQAIAPVRTRLEETLAS